VSRPDPKELANEMARLATRLMSEPPCSSLRPSGGRVESCIMREGGNTKSGHPRAFSDYRENRLCSACSAYWHASMSALALNNIARREAREHEEAAFASAAHLGRTSACSGRRRCQGAGQRARRASRRLTGVGDARTRAAKLGAASMAPSTTPAL
jgi:hypothetical protein